MHSSTALQWKVTVQKLTKLYPHFHSSITLSVLFCWSLKIHCEILWPYDFLVKICHIKRYLERHTMWISQYYCSVWMNSIIPVNSYFIWIFIDLRILFVRVDTLQNIFYRENHWYSKNFNHNFYLKYRPNKILDLV